MSYIKENFQAGGNRVRMTGQNENLIKMISPEMVSKKEAVPEAITNPGSWAFLCLWDATHWERESTSAC